MGAAGHQIIRGGECGDQIRSLDWSKTALGPISDWSAEFISTVNTVLNSPLGIVLLPKSGGCLIYNDAYARFAGAKHPEIMGMDYALAWPEVAAYNKEMCDRIFRGEVVSFSEKLLQLQRNDILEDVYLDLNYSPVFDDSSETIAMQVTVVDVTNNVVSRQQIATARDEASLQRIVAEDTARINQTITENASTAMFIMDENFRCTFMNPAAELMTGFSFAEAKESGRTMHDLIHHSYPDGKSYRAKDCPINEAMAKLSVVSGDEVFIRKDGSYFPVFFVASPIIKDGELTTIILEVRDMTETEQLLELNQVKDEFVALASHQLRTPATSVKQYLGILIQEYAGPVTPDQLQYLEIAYNANERQLTIIDDLLKTARVDMKGYKLKLRSGNLSKLVRQAAKAANSMLESKRQQLVVKLPDEDTRIPFDTTELAICIDNLLENASKYSPAGESITMALREHKNYVDISVEDNGVGIAPADQLAIFDKFTRINNVLSDTVSGNGLGLYWVKRIVDLHKGKIIIKSELGGGTTFVIRLLK